MYFLFIAISNIYCAYYFTLLYFFPRDFFCRECQSDCGNAVNWFQHVAGKAHIKKMATISVPKSQLFCSPCKMQFENKNNFDCHLHSSNHASKCKLSGIVPALPTAPAKIIVNLDYDLEADFDAESVYAHPAPIAAPESSNR